MKSVYACYMEALRSTGVSSRNISRHSWPQWITAEWIEVPEIADIMKHDVLLASKSRRASK